MVIRTEKTKDFTVMSNYHFRDKNISLKARGLLSTMLSLPDTWKFSIEGLAGLCKEGVDSVRSTLNELIKFGYVEKTERIRDEKGRLRGIDYIIHEQPVSQELEGESEESEMSDAEQPELENVEEPVSENAVCKEAALKKSVSEEPALKELALTIPTQENRGQLNTNISNIKELNTNVSNQGVANTNPKKKPDSRAYYPDNEDLNAPVPENPILEKRRLLNTNISNTKELNTNVSNQGAANTKSAKQSDSHRAYYPDNEDLNSAFKDFVYMRKRMNRPLIDRAVRLVKDSLVVLAGEDGKMNIMKAVAILNQSIMNGWSGLYALKAPPDENLVNSAYSAEDMAFFEGNLLAN